MRKRQVVLVVNAVPDNVEILARRRDGLEALQKVTNSCCADPNSARHELGSARQLGLHRLYSAEASLRDPPEAACRGPALLPPDMPHRLDSVVSFRG